MTTKYDALEALEKAAHAGNWDSIELNPEDPSWGACEIWAGEEVVATMVCGVANAQLIAAARNAVPALIADVKALAEALRKIEQSTASPGVRETARAALKRIQGEAG